MAINERGDTAMLWAAYNHSTRVIELLKKHGADIDKENVSVDFYSPMALAASWGDCDTVKKMVDLGANVNDKSNSSPLDMAYANNDSRFGRGYECVREFLKSKGATFKKTTPTEAERVDKLTPTTK